MNIDFFTSGRQTSCVDFSRAAAPPACVADHAEGLPPVRPATWPGGAAFARPRRRFACVPGTPFATVIGTLDPWPPGAGDHVAPVAVWWVLDHLDVIHTFVDHANGDIELSGNFPCLQFASRLLGCTVAEDTGKVYCCYIDPLVYHEPDSKSAVQAAGQ